MNGLSERERASLEDVFLSISSTRTSLFKYKFAYYHGYWTLHFKKGLYAFAGRLFTQMSIKKHLKITIFQKNHKKR